jgi:hypothetical protein
MESEQQDHPTNFTSALHARLGSAPGSGAGFGGPAETILTQTPNKHEKQKKEHGRHGCQVTSGRRGDLAAPKTFATHEI